MARPRAPGVVQIRLTLSLHPERDADLISLFSSLPARKRAARCIAQLRAGPAVNVTAIADDETAEVENNLLSMLED